MRMRPTVTDALAGLRRHRVRTALVMLHIVLSVALVILVAGMAAGLGGVMTSSIHQFVGTVSVAPRSPAEGGESPPTRALRDADVEALAAEADPGLISGVFPIVSGSAVLRNGGADYISPNVVGSTPGYLQLKLMQVQAGQMFTPEQAERRARVVLLGHDLVDYLFHGDPDAALGSTVQIGTRGYQVIGVLGGDGQDNDTVLMPFPTARATLFGAKSTVQGIGASVTATDRIPAAVAEVQRILDREHFVRAPDERDYAITSYSYLLPFMTQWASIPAWFGTGATIALLFIGIVGLAGIMVLAVSDRDEEIQARKRAGASTASIVAEFLVGSVIVAGLAGLIGVGLGVAAILAARVLLPTVSPMYALGPPPVPVETAVLAFGASLLLGLAAGCYPATRAFRLVRGLRPPTFPPAEAPAEPAMVTPADRAAR
jgi:putative ABC transport system permease protein